MPASPPDRQDDAIDHRRHPARMTASEVEHRLADAGQVLLALPHAGCFPAGFRILWPGAVETSSSSDFLPSPTEITLQYRDLRRTLATTLGAPVAATTRSDRSPDTRPGRWSASTSGQTKRLPKAPFSGYRRPRSGTRPKPELNVFRKELNDLR